MKQDSATKLSEELKRNRSASFFLSKPRSFRVIFVHFFHDLRQLRPRNKRELIREVCGNSALSVAVICLCSLASQHVDVAVLEGALGLTNAKYWYLLIVLCFTLTYFVTSLYLIDSFFRCVHSLPPSLSTLVGVSPRLLLVPFNCDVLCTMQSPLRSRSVSEFWSRRWNVQIQQLLREFVFAPLRRLVSGIGFVRRADSANAAHVMTFLVSAMLHFYPLFLITKDVNLVMSADSQFADTHLSEVISTGFFLMALYFVIQSFCVILEQKLRISEHKSWLVIKLWVFGYIILLSPLFIVPVLMTLRLYQR